MWGGFYINVKHTISLIIDQCSEYANDAAREVRPGGIIDVMDASSQWTRSDGNLMQPQAPLRLQPTTRIPAVVWLYYSYIGRDPATTASFDLPRCFFASESLVSFVALLQVLLVSHSTTNSAWHQLRVFQETLKLEMKKSLSSVDLGMSPNSKIRASNGTY